MCVHDYGVKQASVNANHQQMSCEASMRTNEMRMRLQPLPLPTLHLLSGAGFAGTVASHIWVCDYLHLFV
ncbi:unnamed protein product [Ceratitis capitata]|uniref:(Mediterranean fruit fly) hypothetical protein n=1 Tax=Ceratitis capitata TaxID=7213 RepID=A0A811VJ13_CERCA|nr:unnamed protein product [Ceratitis capitata]